MVNQRISYQIKECLKEYVEKSLIHNDDENQMWCVGFVVRNLVTVGLNRFMASWNHHRIPGVNKGIPMERAEESNQLTPILT